MFSIKEIRESKQMTRKDLAEKLKISVSTVESWENSRRFPNRKQAKALSVFLGVPLNKFYDDE